MAKLRSFEQAWYLAEILETEVDYNDIGIYVLDPCPNMINTIFQVGVGDV